MPPSSFSINVKGSLVDLSTPKVMGIINVTPDSFFEGSRKNSLDQILKSAEEMIQSGADFLDIGGYSSRPGADNISIEEELNRVIKPIIEVKNRFPEAILSIDTFRSEVAKEAINSGADIVNDISAGFLDDMMLKTVAELSVPYVAMHMKGTPQSMKSMAHYNDLVIEVVNYFSEVLAKCNHLGLKDVLIDPGFGFAKTITHNFELLSKLELLSVLERSLLVGISRKSMIYKTLDISANEAVNGTTALNTLALIKGASILRVHDVKEAKETIRLFNEVNKF